MSVDKILDRAGGDGEIARAFGLTRAAIWHWRRKRHIPPDRILAVARMARLHPTQICPVLYPPGLVADDYLDAA